MAGQNDITLRAGEAQAKDIRLYALPTASAAPVTTIYLRAFDATASTIILYDPAAVPEAAGGDATASGDTVVVTTAMVDGAATGGAIASGDTVAVTTATVDGIATGAATAQGDAVVVTTAMVDGVATGEAPSADEPAVDVGGSQHVFRAMHRNEKRRKRREQEARERLRATLERAARAIYGESDPPPEAAAAIAEAREVLADTAPSGVVIAFAEADNLALISAAIRQLEAVMREIEDDEEAAVMMLLAA